MLVDLALEHRALPSALRHVTEVTASGSRLLYGDGRGGVNIGDDEIPGSVAVVKLNLKVERTTEPRKFDRRTDVLQGIDGVSCGVRACMQER